MRDILTPSERGVLEYYRKDANETWRYSVEAESEKEMVALVDRLEAKLGWCLKTIRRLRGAGQGAYAAGYSAALDRVEGEMEEGEIAESDWAMIHRSSVEEWRRHERTVDDDGQGG